MPFILGISMSLTMASNGAPAKRSTALMPSGAVATS
jgi:hypothetical protein